MKAGPPPRSKVALKSKQVDSMIKLAVTNNGKEVAALMAIARQFLVRVPSEGIPLQWDGSHSSIALAPKKAVITLMSRKNSRVPVTLTRACICATSGSRLCAVHWLWHLRGSSQASSATRVFQISSSRFSQLIQEYSVSLNLPGGMGASSHAFRRGMAQDILDHGGSLSLLLKARDWCSSAFLRYLRYQQPEDVAAGQTIINLSDPDVEK